MLKGYNGLLNEEIIDMDATSVSDTINRGGTILYTARCLEFIDPEYQKREILSVARRVTQITEDDISQLETELNTVFQPVIAQYYVGCIRILQNRISKL